MKLYHSSDGPALDHGLEERLRRIDPRLKVTFSHWSIDPGTGQPVEAFGQFIHDPAQHLWFRGPDGHWHYIDCFPMAAGGFGHHNARLLEINRAVVHSHKPERIAQLIDERRFLKEAREKDSHFAFRQDRAKANQKRIGDLVFHGKSGRRQANPSSFPGQTNRSTPGDVLKDAREDGWEL